MADLLETISDGVALLTLNRPERLNAYTPEMGELLGAAYRRCDDDPGVRAIVVTGAGRAFCAGADVAAPQVRSTRSAPSSLPHRWNRPPSNCVPRSLPPSTGMRSVSV